MRFKNKSTHWYQFLIDHYKILSDFLRCSNGYYVRSLVSYITSYVQRVSKLVLGIWTKWIRDSVVNELKMNKLTLLNIIKLSNLFFFLVLSKWLSKISMAPMSSWYLLRTASLSFLLKTRTISVFIRGQDAIRAVSSTAGFLTWKSNSI